MLCFLFLHWLRFWPWENTGHFSEWKDKSPCHFNIIDMYRFNFQIGRALGPVYIYFGKFQKVLFLTFASCSPYFTQKLLETVGSLGCSAPSFQQFIPSICKDEEEQLTPFRNRAPTNGKSIWCLPNSQATIRGERSPWCKDGALRPILPTVNWFFLC